MSRAPLLVTALLALLATPAAAHRLNVDARVERGLVRVEVYFSDGTASSGAEVVVTRAGEAVARGVTDPAGRYEVRPTRAGVYAISVTEPGLHRGSAEVVVRPEDLLASDAAAPSSALAPPPSRDRGRVDLARTLQGLAIVLGLAGVLALAQRPGWLTRRDDRARLVAFALVAAPLSVAQSSRALALGGLAGLLVAATSGLAPGVALRRLSPVLVLIVPVALLTPLWSPPGAHPLLAAWPDGPTQEGARVAVDVALRALGLGLLAVGAFAAPLPRTLQGLHGLRAPAALVHTALLTVRFVEQVGDDLARARLALSLRAFRPRADLATSRTYAALTGALLVRSLARTERVETAMRLRGYDGRPALAAAGPWRVADTALLAAALGLAAALVALDRGGA